MKNQEVETKNPAENTNLPASQTDNLPAMGQSMNTASFSPSEIIEVNKVALQKAEVKSINMSLEYHEFEAGVEIRGIYLGLTTYRCEDKQNPGEEKVLAAAVFVDMDGNPKLNCAAKFVDAVSRFELKTPFSAVHTRIKKTSSGGNMQLFDIRKLDYKTN